MIKTKEDLREYIELDKKRYSLRMPWRLGIFIGNEPCHAFRMVRTLRYYEYAVNNSNSWFGKLRLLFWSFIFRLRSYKYKIYIKPNSIGPGLHIVHFGGGIYINCNKVGRYFSISSGCIVGNKDGNENVATIGDNVTMTIGSKVIGKISVGDNVVIAPNSVVVKDIPSDSVVSGIPAKVIKTKVASGTNEPG